MNRRSTPDSPALVRDFYLTLVQSTDGQVKARFEAWLCHFDVVHGPLERKKLVDREKLASVYGIPAEGLDLKLLLFCVETSFAFYMKVMAERAWLSAQRRQTTEEGGAAADRSPQHIRAVFRGEFVPVHAIPNYAVSDSFDWPALLTNPSVVDAIWQEYDRLCAEALPVHELVKRDRLRALYEQLVPHAVRHAIGAFYTPDWLADYVVRTVTGSDRQFTGGLTDPTCGSGAFLVAALRRLIEAVDEGELSATEALIRIRDGLVGYDVNPIAIAAARTNLMVFVSALIQRGGRLPEGGLRLPVYLCDSVWPVAGSTKPLGGEQNSLDLGTPTVALRVAGETVRVRTADLDPSSWPDAVARALEAVRKDEDNVDAERSGLVSFLRSYDRRGMLLLGQTLLLDAAAPVFHSPSRVVVGNPPWVNWEYLPPTYKDGIKHLWPTLGLFEASGLNLANSKEDLSTLVTFVACERYLHDGGTLGFVLPQAVFKSPLNSRGFRGFELHTHAGNTVPLGVVRVDDMVAVRPFEGVANRTAILILRKGAKTRYPIPYYVWGRRAGTKWSPDAEAWADVLPRLTVANEVATPVGSEDYSSHWLTGPPQAVAVLSKLEGSSPYRARTGIFTGGANGVYYLTLEKELPSGNLLVRNYVERAKRVVEQITAEIEPTFVYPLLRGRDVDRWSYSSSLLTICPHTSATKMKPVPLEVMREQAPLTLAYLERFRDALDERRGFATWERKVLEEGFYAIQRVGDYTFAPYKVVWRYIASDFRSCVLEPGRQPTGVHGTPLPHEKLMLLPFETAAEAYFVGALLNSAPVRFYVESHMVSTQIAPHVISKLGLPTFLATDPRHVALSENARAAQEAKGPQARSMAQQEIDKIAAAMLGLTQAELLALQALLPVAEKGDRPEDD